MPVIPPSRSEPYSPPSEVHAPDEERLVKTSGTERWVLVVVGIMILLVVIAVLVIPHSPWAESFAE